MLGANKKPQENLRFKNNLKSSLLILTNIKWSKLSNFKTHVINLSFSSYFRAKNMCYYSILFLLELWHIAVVTNLKTTVNTIAKNAAVILALNYPNGEFIPPYNDPSLRQAF